MLNQKISSFGEFVRELRLGTGLSIRKVAAQLDVDPSLLGKIERNERQPTKDLITKIAEFFNVDSDKLSSEALTDKIAIQIVEENADSKLLRVAEVKVEYFKSKK